MIDTRYAELKLTLQARRGELQRELAAKLRAVRANDARDGQPAGGLDLAEASNSELEQDVGVALTQMTVEALSRIDGALERITSGVYGVCAECNGRISQKRLMALPFAVRCRECEELYEIGQKRSRRLSTRRSASLPPFEPGA